MWKWKGLGCCRLGVGSDDRVLTRDSTSGEVGDCCGEGVFVAVSVGAAGEIGDLFWVDAGLEGVFVTSDSKYGFE